MIVDGDKIEVPIDGKKEIKARDSEISKGQIALITEQRLPLTVIDDFLVRPIGKKGMFSKKSSGKESQPIAQASPSSDSSSSLEIFDYQSLKEHGKREKGPNSDHEENSYSLAVSCELSAVSPESPELFSPFSPFSHFSPEPDPIYQTTSSLPPSELLLYYHHDHLGNIRAVTDQNGNVVERHDFYPFGEEITTQPQNTYQYLFTGKPRDSETGLDYFGARYYSYSLSRWMSPDVITDIKRNIENPQRWNLYIYVLNNPIKFLDPEGNEEKISYFIVVDPAPPKVTAGGTAWKILEEFDNLTRTSTSVDARLNFLIKEDATLEMFKKEIKESSMVAFLGHAYMEFGIPIGLIFSDNTLKETKLDSKASIIFLAACRSASENSKIADLFGISKENKGSALVGFAGRPKTGYMAEALREFSKWILQGHSVDDAVKKTNEYLKNKINEMNIKAGGRQQYQFIPLTMIGDPNVSLSK